VFTKKLLDAIRKNDTKAVTKFMDDNAEALSRNEEALIAFMEYAESPRKRYGETVNDSDDTIAFFDAIEKGDVAEIEKLLEQGFDVNARNSKGRAPLVHAARHSTEVLKRLLRVEGIDVNIRAAGGTTALIEASGSSPEGVKALLGKEGLDIGASDSSGFTALMTACLSGSSEIVKSLLHSKDAGVNRSNVAGDTALMLAAQCSADAFKEILKVQGVDVNAKNKLGETALMEAARGQSPEPLRLLLGTKRVKVNARNKCGDTALMLAAQYSPESLKILASVHGIDFNAKTEDGWTALMEAACWGRSESVKKLLEFEDIDVGVENSAGRTALGYAVESDMGDDILHAFFSRRKLSEDELAAIEKTTNRSIRESYVDFVAEMDSAMSTVLNSIKERGRIDVEEDFPNSNGKHYFLNHTLNDSFAPYLLVSAFDGVDFDKENPNYSLVRKYLKKSLSATKKGGTRKKRGKRGRRGNAAFRGEGSSVALGRRG